MQKWLREAGSSNDLEVRNKAYSASIKRITEQAYFGIAAQRECPPDAPLWTFDVSAHHEIGRCAGLGAAQTMRRDRRFGSGRPRGERGASSTLRPAACAIGTACARIDANITIRLPNGSSLPLGSQAQ